MTIPRKHRISYTTKKDMEGFTSRVGPSIPNKIKPRNKFKSFNNT